MRIGKPSRIVCVLLAIAAVRCFSAEISVDLRPRNGQLAQTTVLNAASNAISDDGVVRQHRLSVGAAEVQGLAVGDLLILSLFEDRELQIELVSEEHSLVGRSFLGRMQNGLGLVDCVVLETENGLVVDVTDSKNNRVWKVISDENGVQIKEVKPTQRNIRPSKPLYPPKPGTQVPVVDVMVNGGVATVVTNRLLQSVAVGTGTSSQQNVVFQNPPGCNVNVMSADVAAGVTLPTIDILVVYDTDAASWAKSNGGGIQSFAETSVQKMNTAIANTGLNTKFSFRLVGTCEVGGSAGGDLEYALYFASGTKKGTLNGVSWAGVQQKRDELHADIVCTLVDTGSAYGTTGLGWSLVSTTSDPASCGGNACAIRSVAQSHTMTHEVGHNMGAGHSDQMADKDNCGPQYHNYSSGYYFTANGGKYYTIMSYNTDGYGIYYTEVPYFSSPDYKYLGVAVGDATHNNSKTLSLTYSTIVNNRREPVDAAQVGAAIGASGYEWTTSGDYPWSVISDASTVGGTAARSCEMAGNTTSWLRTTVIGPATLSFDYQMRTYGGHFSVMYDSTVLFERQNEAIPSMTWSSKSVSIPSGSHTVQFAYTHPNGGYTGGWGNGVRLDNVVFSGGSSPSQTYAIAFNANGGSPTPASITRKANEAYGTLPTPTRTGYALAGWYTAASGGTKVSSTTKATANATLYAQWTANSYNVSYSLNGGSQGTTHPTNGTYDKEFYVSAPMRSDRTFTGWTVTSGLNASTAKWGTGSNPSLQVSGTNTKCANGATGNVYFKNLTAVSGGSVTLTANWTENSTIPLATALDNASLAFTAEGDVSWLGQSTTTHDGVDAARSGKILANQSSCVRTSVAGPGIISFWWYASCEGGNYDYLSFSIDGTQKAKIGGTSASWTKCSYLLESGSHTLRWTYRKDGSVDTGLDAGFVDQVAWEPNVVSSIQVVSGYKGNLYFMSLAKGGAQFYVDDFDLAELGIDISDGVTTTLMNGIGRNGLPRYQSLLFGLDPESPIPAEEQIKPTIEFDSSGLPVISCSPRNDNSLITYTTLGKPSLTSPQWTEVTSGNRASMKFFKVQVGLK